MEEKESMGLVNLSSQRVERRSIMLRQKVVVIVSMFLLEMDSLILLWME